MIIDVMDGDYEKLHVSRLLHILRDRRERLEAKHARIADLVEGVESWISDVKRDCDHYWQDGTSALKGEFMYTRCQICG